MRWPRRWRRQARGATNLRPADSLAQRKFLRPHPCAGVLLRGFARAPNLANCSSRTSAALSGPLRCAVISVTDRRELVDTATGNWRAKTNRVALGSWREELAVSITRPHRG